MDTIVREISVGDVVKAIEDLHFPGFGNDGTTIFSDTHGLVENRIGPIADVAWEIGERGTYTFRTSLWLVRLVRD